jgi:hypothetical protein
VSVNISHSVFLILFLPGNLSIQALVVSAAMNLHSVASLCNIIYSSVSLYVSFCILFSLILAYNCYNQEINRSGL